MENLKDKISEELKASMRAKDRVRTSTLRMILSEIKVAEKSGKDFKCSEIIKSYGKKVKKSIEEYKKLGSDDQAFLLEKELDIVNEYLPKQMSEEQLINVIDEIIESNDFTSKDMGKVIKLVMSKYNDIVDGKQVQLIVKNKLA